MNFHLSAIPPPQIPHTQVLLKYVRVLNGEVKPDSSDGHLPPREQKYQSVEKPLSLPICLNARKPSVNIYNKQNVDNDISFIFNHG